MSGGTRGQRGGTTGYDTPRQPEVAASSLAPSTAVRTASGSQSRRTAGGQFQAVPIQDRFWPKVSMGDGCWEWQASLGTKGYGLTSIGPRTRTAHRVAWELTKGPIPAGLFVCHHCDNPRCVRPDHLFLGTNRDNQLDALAKGRLATGARNGVHKNTPRGERIGTAKLNAALVLEIRQSTGTLAALAQRYGMGTSQIGRIRRRENWRHV